ncbi:MAG: dTDP-glucose 4,6-dehydratase [Verrucomicrobiota bacterium]|nr:dTDP-glucose 4,6-dehydratase [Verrucomicrobiota bacterium]
MKKILVTGGAGFIGSNLVRLLLKEKNCSVIIVDKLTYAANLESLNDLKDMPSYFFEQLDLGGASSSCRASSKSLQSLFQKHRPDAVVHLAAESHVDRSIDGPGEFIQSNVIGTYNLLQAALQYWEKLPAHAQSKFRFLHVSTDEVYGSLPPNALGFSETTRYDPHSPYSASKAASDHLVRAWGETYGLPVLVTNCSNNYGPYQFPEKLIPLVILKCLHGEPIPVYGKGANIRDWLYVSDHSEALHLVLTKGKAGETYTIGGNNELHNIELVRMLCQLMDELRDQNTTPQDLTTARSPLSSGKGFESLIIFVADRPGHDMRYAIDSTKIRDELGWEAKVDIESGLRKTVQWYLSNPNWWERILSGDYQLERLGESSTSP